VFFHSPPATRTCHFKEIAVTLHDLVSQTILDTLNTSLPAFVPELVLCGTLVVMLVVKLFHFGRWIDAFYFALVGSAVALFFAAPWTYLSDPAGLPRQEIFTGLLVCDALTVFMRSVLLLFCVLLTILTRLTGMPDREDATDFYALVLGATLGMCIMVSANHLLMIFLGIEMASVPSYVLAGMRKGSRKDSEAALKYAVYGGGAAGVMLYGISLLAGVLHSAHLPTMATQLARDLPGMLGPNGEPGLVIVLALGGLMVMVGLAFKLAAVPFHFWCPDVFEGAAAEVGALLSVASKAAALALLVRVAIGFSTVPPASPDAQVVTLRDTSLGSGIRKNSDKLDPVSHRNSCEFRYKTLPPAAGAAQEGQVAERDAVSADHAAGLFNVADTVEGNSGGLTAGVSVNHDTKPSSESSQASPARGALCPARDFIARLIALIAVITCTFGNLAAYGQTNMKRLLAYSTIAHAGYMMMPVAAAVAMIGANGELAEAAVGSLALYIGIYLFMNLGAFAVVAFLRNALGSEEIADYAGLVRRLPVVTVCLSLIMFSLLGLPPLAGFIAKFAIFASLVDGWRVTSDGYLMVLVVVAGINTAISLFYYLRVVKVMTIDPAPEGSRQWDLPLPTSAGVYVAVVTAPLVLLILSWNWLSEWALAAANNLIS